jgi:hypothetical protein
MRAYRALVRPASTSRGHKGKQMLAGAAPALHIKN